MVDIELDRFDMARGYGSTLVSVLWRYFVVIYDNSWRDVVDC